MEKDARDDDSEITDQHRRRTQMPALVVAVGSPPAHQSNQPWGMPLCTQYHPPAMVRTNKVNVANYFAVSAKSLWPFPWHTHLCQPALGFLCDGSPALYLCVRLQLLLVRQLSDPRHIMTNKWLSVRHRADRLMIMKRNSSAVSCKQSQTTATMSMPHTRHVS